jgi:hypothetical protein
MLFFVASDAANDFFCDSTKMSTFPNEAFRREAKSRRDERLPRTYKDLVKELAKDLFGGLQRTLTKNVRASNQEVINKE